MRRTSLTIAVALVLCALGALGAQSAAAESAPFFTIGGARLAAGKTHNIDERAVTTFVGQDALGTSRMQCTGISTEHGVLLGAEEGNGGFSGGEVAVFSGCRLEGNGPNCHVAPSEGSTETTTTITTNPIKGAQVLSVVGGHTGSKLLSLLAPASKGAGFGKLDFGGECTVKSTIVSGSLAVEDLLDNASERNVELGQAPQERTSWDLRQPATPITAVWLVSGGVGKEVEVGVTAFNEEAIGRGTVLLLLASTKFVPEPNALWSPLP